IGVDTGGSNVQFGIHAQSGRVVVIEMNPRVSRSSALASKATGFPIAKVAAKLAVGYTLDELRNEITQGKTPASFEPSIDYVVTKIPRFAFEKFPAADARLTTQMKSVGEVMAIGRTFAESLQKALRGLETGKTGLDPTGLDLATDDGLAALKRELREPSPERIFHIGDAFRAGLSVEEVFTLSHVDPWFLDQIEALIIAEREVSAAGLRALDARGLRHLKRQGFSDARIAQLTDTDESAVRALRHAFDLRPVYKRVDSCAAEFATDTAYLYSTYEDECEAQPTARRKIMVLGGGPNRIGQGIEFDYCCVHAALALREDGFETIMVNCNPETVSTDFDTSDRLYFEPLTEEDVIEIVRKEETNGTLKGVIVQFGGQTPLKLAEALERVNVPILGTSPDAIDLAEDRDRFKALVERLGLKQPRNGIARSAEEAVAIAMEIGFPVVIRPSYVLGGRAMEIVHDEQQLARYIAEAVVVSGKSPVLIDSYLRDAIEVDVDAIADGTDVFICGVMEHIEEAGVHSGDSACSLPPHSLKPEIIAELEQQTVKLARALNVVGLMNVQFAIQNDDIYLLEVNPRASRTVPFVAKVIGLPIASIAAQVMTGKKLASFQLDRPKFDHIAVKEAVFPFARFPGVDPVLGPEMRSTGEVMGIDRNYAIAFAKSQLGGGSKLPLTGTVFVSVKDADKEKVVAPIRALAEMGFRIIATRGTKRHLDAMDVPCERVNKVLEGRPHIVDAITNGEVDIVFNTTEGAKALADSFSIRRSALLNHVPYYTTVAGAAAVTEAIKALRSGSLEVAPLQSYIGQYARHFTETPQ
ncbi:MAG: carbamoyl-phosphate synthase large subunit, partial [Methyloceanibacter sp.]|uniref:carbamoyl-phosphate synthase large subunit n=1 Tax=Methyloceanibacter sp. TaxID=1965321 RepID=UPI003D9AD3F3